MGLASYMIDDDFNILLFADTEKGEEGFISTETGFHAWIETNDWFIDFTSPLFPEMCKEKGINSPIEPKMFQKKKNEMADSGFNLAKKGDFIFVGNYELTDQLIDLFTSYQANLDLTNICNHWYKKSPEKMIPMIPISDQNGSVKMLQFNTTPILSSW